MATSRIRMTNALLERLLALPTGVRVTGLAASEVPDCVEILVEGDYLPSDPTPVYTMRETKRENLPETVGRITMHWSHDPDVEHETGALFDYTVRR